MQSGTKTDAVAKSKVTAFLLEILWVLVLIAVLFSWTLEILSIQDIIIGQNAHTFRYVKRITNVVIRNVAENTYIGRKEKTSTMFCFTGVLFHSLLNHLSFLDVRERILTETIAFQHKIYKLKNWKFKWFVRNSICRKIWMESQSCLIKMWLLLVPIKTAVATFSRLLTAREIPSGSRSSS